MKTKRTLIILSLAVIIALMALSMSSCVTIRLNTVEGSGNITKQEVDISGAEKVVFTGLGEIIIEQGDKDSLLIEADDNLLDYIKADVSGDRLTIGFKRGVISVIPTKTPKFYLSLESIERIELTGAGSINGEDIEAESLDIESTGLGSVDLEKIKVEDLSVEISGAGNIRLSGEVYRQSIKIPGLGSYKAKDLKSDEATIELSGAGKATVNVSDLLDVNISGLGSVEYVGDPSVTQKITGPGSIRSID